MLQKTKEQKKNCRTVCPISHITSFANIRQFFFSSKKITNKKAMDLNFVIWISLMTASTVGLLWSLMELIKELRFKRRINNRNYLTALEAKRTELQDRLIIYRAELSRILETASLAAGFLLRLICDIKDEINKLENEINKNKKP